MKSFFKYFFIIFILLNCNFAVSAYEGDIISPIYETDILTYVDDVPIQGYAIDGKTMICLEDLKNYGFSVMYDNSIRTLFVTKTGKRESTFNPYFKRGKIGDISGYIYDTDIKAIVNGVYSTAYAIDGKMVAAVEDLGTYEYKMRFEYNNSVRSLWLYTECTDNSSEDKYFHLKRDSIEPYLDIILGKDYAIHYFGIFYRLKFNGDFSAYISYKNGDGNICLTTALHAYGIETNNVELIYDDFGNLKYPCFKLSNNEEQLIFSLSENDTYIMNPYTMCINKISAVY